MKEMELYPKKEELAPLIDFVTSSVNLEYADQFKLELVIEEIFVNIVTYSNATSLTISVDINEYIELIFIDNGIKFNPLIAPDPDISSEIDEREPGGLGIFLVKELMDDIIYEYKDDKNYLKLVKKLN